MAQAPYVSTPTYHALVLHLHGSQGGERADVCQQGGMGGGACFPPQVLQPWQLGQHHEEGVATTRLAQLRAAQQERGIE